VSPELLESSETSKRSVLNSILNVCVIVLMPYSSDLWAVGCIIYQMIAGRFAFQGLSDYLTWQKVKALDYSFPNGFDPQAKDLVQKLLIRNPLERLGAGEPGSVNDIAALKSHPFFESVDWSTLWTRPAPPLEPGLFRKEEQSSAVNAQAEHNWDDVGYNWEDMVGLPRAQDGIPWISGEEDDGNEEVDERTETVHSSASVAPLELPLVQQDLNEVNIDVVEAISEGNDADHLALHELSSSKPIDVPTAEEPHEVSHAGSATSSSEGSPIEKLGAALEAALNRGRNRAQTPIQGNEVPSPNW
jgi:3-phosphoinositide dependent protein kinase-1